MTQIIGFHGKKQSGKDTSCNFLIMLKLLENGVSERARLNDEGVIEVSDVFGQRINNMEWMPFKKNVIDVDSVLEELSIKKYGFADKLKQLLIDIFGLPEDKVYGSNADKEEKTYLKWQNMPGVISKNKRVFNQVVKEIPMVKNKFFYHEPGYMTIRDVLQYVGTEIFRSIYGPVWIEALLRQIKKESPKMALICDVRFSNEIETIKSKDGLVVGLTKDVFESSDNHESEQTYFDLCSAVIDNQLLSISEQNKLVYSTLKELKCDHLPIIEV